MKSPKFNSTEISIPEMKITLSSKIFFTIVAFFTIFVTNYSISEELVNGEGFGVADTKNKSCEIALNNARREASQSATTLVQAQFSSLETSSGVSHKTDVLETTISYAKLTTKNESIDFDPKSGLIKCAVNATFRVGALTKESKVKPLSKTPTTNSHSPVSTIQKLHIAKSGEPFCITILNSCFREYYNQGRKKFGIQIIKGIGPNGGSMYSFFNSASSSYIEVGDWYGKSTKIETKEDLLKIPKILEDKIQDGKSCDSCPTFLYYRYYNWDSENNKFKRSEKVGVIYGPSPDEMTGFFYEGISLTAQEILKFQSGAI